MPMKRKWIMMVTALLLLTAMVIAPVSASAASKKIVYVVKITVQGARLREGPSSAYKIITSLPKDSRVFTLNKRQNAFCFVYTEDGQRGFVYKGFLKAYGAVAVDQVYYNKNNSLTVYKKANTNSGRVTTLYKNQHIIVYQTQGEWAYIKTLRGKGGFVKISGLRKATK